MGSGSELYSKEGTLKMETLSNTPRWPGVATLLHDRIGVVEFKWDNEDSVSVWFIPRKWLPSWTVAGVRLEYNKVHFITKAEGRAVWDSLLESKWRVAGISQPQFASLPPEFEK
jgi:hypothetical protein